MFVSARHLRYKSPLHALVEWLYIIQYCVYDVLSSKTGYLNQPGLEPRAEATAPVALAAVQTSFRGLVRAAAALAYLVAT